MMLNEAISRLDQCFAGQIDTFPSRLTSLLKERGITQAEFAARIGVTPQEVSYWKKGREPKFSVVKRTAEFLEVTTDYLLGANGGAASVVSACVPPAAAWEVVKNELDRYMALGTVEELEETLYNATL